MEKNNNQTTAAQATTAANADQATTAAQQTPFEHLLRAYEHATAAGADATTPLLALAQAVALSVVAKCIDPQRKAAAERQTVSNGGQNPALRDIRRGIMADLALLENTTAAHNAATAFRYNTEGEYVREVVDKAAEQAAAALMDETLSEGIDLVNTAIVAILEQTAEHATAGENWLEKPFTIRRLSRRVIIRAEDSAKWEEVETTPISEVYRAVRREVQNSKAMQTDPRNGYSYIEDVAADPDSTATETIYRRLHKWADLGGYTMTGHYDEHGNASRGGQYTTTAAAVADYDSILSALNLSTRQASVLRLRMSGYGITAIGSYLGIPFQNVRRTLLQIAAKCEKIGFTPSMWAEMTAEK